MKLPPDLDRLAWSVAESGDPRLRAEFAARYPDHAEEMERRAALVDDRGHLPAHADSGIALPKRRVPVPIWAVVFAGLAVGGIVVAALLPRRTATESAEPIVAARAPAADAATNTVPTIIANQATPTGGPQDMPPVSTTAPPTITTATPRPTSLRLEGTALHDAVALIAAAGQFTARFDPQIPDPEVRQNFSDLTPREMIDRLGSEYGFRIVEESPGSLLLVPIGEPTSGEDGQNDPSAPPAGAESGPVGDTNNPAGGDFPNYADGNR